MKGKNIEIVEMKRGRKVRLGRHVMECEGEKVEI